MPDIAQDAAPFQIVPAQDHPDALSDVVLVCDHASNRVPPEIDLGVPPEDMARHIAWDVGAQGVTLGLARHLGTAAILSRFSRLVIDPNRDPLDPTLVMKLYDGSLIPGNRHADAAEIARRLAAYHQPYHGAIAGMVDTIEAAGGQPALISIHSYTPQLRGKPIRPWHVGILWDQDDRLVRPLLAELRADLDIVVGDNEPYSGQLAGDCMNTHGTQRGIPHALIEIRNDLISTPDDQQAWADKLAPVLRRALAVMRQEESYEGT